MTNDQAMAYKARPYFKTKFSGIGDLVYSNQQNGQEMVKNSKIVGPKNYTKRQLNKLGDDMKSMIFELDKIDKMLPKTQPGSRSGSRAGRLGRPGSRTNSLNVSRDSSSSEIRGMSGIRRQRNFKIGSGGTRESSLIKQGNFL